MTATAEKTAGVVDGHVVETHSPAAGADVESTALEIAQRVPDTIAIYREPTVVLAEAHRAAAALAQVINAKPKKVVFNGEQYLENEDWQTVGHFYGVTPKIESDSFVQFGNVNGFEAVAVAHDRTGREIGRAIAMCLNDEENWGPRPKYEYHYVTKSGKVQKEDPGRDQIVWEDGKNAGDKKRPKKERVHVGDEPTPLFQLRSMAQTRAMSKVLRSVLGFVPVLAGYRPTPAEELNVERVDNDKHAGSGSTSSASERKPQSRSANGGGNSAPPAGVVDADLVDQAGDAGGEQQQTGSDVYDITRLVELKKGSNDRGDWVLYGIETQQLGDKVYVGTMDRALAKIAFDAKKAGKRVRMKFATEQKGQYTNRNLQTIAAID